MKKFIRFIVSLATPLVIGFVGSITTQSAINEWYAYLNKPSLSPPNWIFAPVWTTLYILLGINLYSLWTQFIDRKLEGRILIWFLIQLSLNALWSPIFFGLQAPALALIVIVMLIITLLYLAWQLFSQHKLNFYLLLPYLAWVSFATYLNAAIWVLN